MANLNICQFIGNVGKIETRFAPSGDAICNVSLAVNESWKDKQTGEKKERTEWVRVVFFGKTAEIAEKYVKVGQSLYVSGKFTTRKWQDKSGADQYTTEIRADQMQMLGGKDAQEQEHRTPPAKAADRPAPSNSFDDFESDIPF